MMSVKEEKKFVYLIQSAAEMPYPDLPDHCNDIILLTWQRTADDPDAIFYPDSTWNEGRNRLLAEALKRSSATGNNYLYYIFMDDDCVVEEDRALAKELGISLTGNPFRTFEKFLLEWEPAVGYTRYAWQYFEPGKETNIGYNIDGNFNAFHRETLSFLLPYYTGFDSESWLYSQHIINHLTAILYNPYRVQFNLITTKNKRQRSYRPRKKYWWIPTTFLMNAITSHMADKMNVADPNTIFPVAGQPQKKDRSYVISQSFIHANFDIHHPLIKYRRLDDVNPNSNSRISTKKPKTAVCISGRCRALKQTWKNIQQNLLDRLADYDLFMYVPKDQYSDRAFLLNPTVLKEVEDHDIDEGNLINGKNCRLKAGVQPYLQQLCGLKMCNHLRLKYAKQMDIHYDCVIRCRPDILFLEPVDSIAKLNLNTIYLPDFHQFDGCNDRFAIGNAANMNIYFNQFDHFHDYALNWLKKNKKAIPVSAEMFTAGHLRQHNVKTRTIAVRFNRVRTHKISRDNRL
jgi:hypothetical protein